MLQQVLATPRFEDLLSEFPLLLAFLKERGADVARCGRAWRDDDQYVFNFISQAHTSDVFGSSKGAFPFALVLSKKTGVVAGGGPMLMSRTT